MTALAQTHLERVGELWGLHSFQLVRKMVNTIYSAKGKKEEFIVRLTPSHLRQKEEIEVELEWLRELRERGISVACPVLSFGKKYLEDLDGHHVVVFEKVPGKPAGRQEMTPEFFQDLGRSLGKIHRVSQRFDPNNKRHDWQDQLDSMIEGYDEDLAPLKTLLLYRDEFPKFPHNWEEYGLVHGDFHLGNFHVHKEKVTFFDFEDCCYHFYEENRKYKR